MAGLRPPKIAEITNDVERMLIMGPAGAGKSYAFWTIVRLATESGSDAKFYVLDIDRSLGRMLRDPGFACLRKEDGLPIDSIIFCQPNNWEEVMAAIADYQSQMRFQDWMCIDMLSPTYVMVQDWYTRGVYKADLSDYFIEKRLALPTNAKNMNPFEGGKDWSTINEQYSKLQNAMLRSPGQLMCTSEVKSTDGATLDKQLKALFGPHGIQPVGQKRSPHVFSTILSVAQDLYGAREFTTIKDRSRKLLEAEVLNDFGKEYLIPVAGWEMGKSKEEIMAEMKAKREAAKAAKELITVEMSATSEALAEGVRAVEETLAAGVLV